MPSSKPTRRLTDIIDNVEAILRYTEGMDANQFEEDRKTYDAVERCLERISEAVTKLGKDADRLIPGLPSDEIRGLGNRLRHEYDTIRPDRLWDVVQNDLPSLLAACRAALPRLDSGN